LQTAVLIVSLLLMIAGFAGVILPFLPDLILVFIGALVYTLFNGFSIITPTILTIFAGLTILSFVIDILSSLLGAKTQKASKFGQIGAVVGAIVGLFTTGLLGIILGPILGVIFFEILFARKKFSQAIQAGIGSLIGFIFGSLLKLVLASFMIGWFVKLIIF